MYNKVFLCGKPIPIHDVAMITAIPIEIVLIVMWGVTIGLSLGDQWWIGWLIAAFTLTGICTVLAWAIVRIPINHDTHRSMVQTG